MKAKNLAKIMILIVITGITCYLLSSILFLTLSIIFIELTNAFSIIFIKLTSNSPNLSVNHLIAVLDFLSYFVNIMAFVFCLYLVGKILKSQNIKKNTDKN